ncbi:MAG: hypothetical protein JXR83_10325 [Deltaproteobacteria bacterium]|nr:hypothetical protein [Deltaproteobacteria bacterium]
MRAMRRAAWSVFCSALAAAGLLTACQPPPGGTCLSSNDCRPDEICIEQRCRLACNSNVDCRGTEECRSGFCQALVDAGAIDRARPDANPVDRTSTDGAVADTCAPPDPAWWDTAFAYRAPLIISAAPAEYTLELDLREAAASDLFLRSLMPNGDDLRIVWLEGNATEIDRELIALGSDRIALRFRLQPSESYPGGSDDYYLYVGSVSSTAAPTDLHNVYRFFDDFEGHAIDSNGHPQFDTGPSGAWQIVQSEAHGRVLRAGNINACYGQIADTAVADGMLEADVALLAASEQSALAGLLIRASGLPDYGATYYNVALWSEEDLFRIGHIVNGNPAGVVASTQTTVHFQRWYHLAAWFTGSDVSATLDDGLTIDGSNLAVGDTQAGLVTFQSAAMFDNVKLRKLVVPEPTVSLGAWETACQ